MSEIKSSFHPSAEDVQAFLLSSILISAAFIVFYEDYTAVAALTTTLGTVIILLAREIGQRTVAQWMDAYVDLEISQEGSVTTVFGIIITALTNLPLLLLFPLQSEFEGHKYEQWGKSVDAIWAKRQFWLVTAGMIGMMSISITSMISGFTQTTLMSIYFTILQLLPFDFWGIPTGELDGAYILRWSGFAWLALMGANLVLLGLTLA